MTYVDTRLLENQLTVVREAKSEFIVNILDVPTHLINRSHETNII